MSRWIYVIDAVLFLLAGYFRIVNGHSDDDVLLAICYGCVAFSNIIYAVLFY